MNSPRHTGSRRCAYLLLDTVVATGMLIVGLAVLGAQVQDSHSAVRKMDRRIRALSLAEQYLAELEMGLVDIGSVDEIVEGDFGPRFPDFGWLLTTEETAIEQMFLLRLDILHLLRKGDYKENSFKHEDAELIETVYVMKAAPQPINFGADFGLNDEEMADLAEKLSKECFPGFDPESFDWAQIQEMDFGELIKCLPDVLGALGISLDQALAMLPADIRKQVEESGILDQSSDDGEGKEEN